MTNTTITLGSFLEVCGMGTVVHVGAENGSGWVFTGTVKEAMEQMADWADREVVWFFHHEGREAIPGYCCEMKPGIGIRVEGYECGKY